LETKLFLGISYLEFVENSIRPWHRAWHSGQFCGGCSFVGACQPGFLFQTESCPKAQSLPWPSPSCSGGHWVSVNHPQKEKVGDQRPSPVLEAPGTLLLHSQRGKTCGGAADTRQMLFHLLSLSTEEGVFSVGPSMV